MMEYASQHPGSSPAGDVMLAACKHRVFRALGAAAVLCYLLAGRASAATFTPLTLQNGWTNAPGGLRHPAVSLVSGIVQFDGAMATTSTNPTKGRLFIDSTGTVTVEAEAGNFANAQCLTSLEGASFALSASGFMQPTVQTSGWLICCFQRNSPVSRFSAMTVSSSWPGPSVPVKPFPVPWNTVRDAASIAGLLQIPAPEGAYLATPSGQLPARSAGGIVYRRQRTCTWPVARLTETNWPRAVQHGYAGSVAAASSPLATPT